MKHIKMLSLAVVAATALMAFVGAGTAAAKEGVLCSTATDPCTSKWAVPTVIDFSIQAGSSATLTTTAGETLVTCKEGTVKGELTANPDATGTATGKNTSITWGGCTSTVDTLTPGKLKIEAEGSGNGIVYSDESPVVTVSIFGVTCSYGIEAGLQIGTISEGVGTAATFKANANVKKTAGGFLCPETTKWIATYVLTSPSTTTLYVSHK